MFKFDAKFFEKNQKILLKLARSKWTRWLLGLNRMAKENDDILADIQKITPASVHTSKLVLKNGKLVREYYSANFTRPRFAEALVYNLHPFVSFLSKDRKRLIWRLSPVGALALLVTPFIPKLGFLGFIGTVTDYAVGSGDGIVGFWGTANNSWSTWRDALSGNINNTTNTTGNDGSLGDSPNIGIDGNGRYGGTRLFIPVDTSGIGSGNLVSAASLFLCSDSGKTRVTWADNNVEITQSNVVSNTALANADFDLWGSVKWATGIAHSALAANGTFNEFVLNSTGYGAVNKTGFSKYCVRFAYDVDNSAPGITAGARIVASFRLSEYTGSTSDPYLRVTYAPDSTEVVIEKDLQYAVLKDHVVTKSLRYAVANSIAIQKSQRYTVKTTPAAIEKSLRYDVLNTRIQKPLQYAVRSSQTIEKDLAYYIGQTFVIQKDLAYSIRSVETIQKSLAYSVAGSGLITKSLRYAISRPSRIKKNISIKSYTSAGQFIREISDADFAGFNKVINQGLGDCLITIGRKFDDIGADFVEGNHIEIWLTDKETVQYQFGPLRSKKIYSGYVKLVEPMIQGGDEKVQITCAGYGVLLGLDVLKNGSQTTLYTDDGVGLTTTGGNLDDADISEVMQAIIDTYRGNTANPRIGYTTASIPSVGSNMTFTFEQRTYREAIDKCLSAAPFGYYWYLDEEGLFSFKGIDSEPTHKFVFGKHFNEVLVSRSIEKLRNFIAIWNGLASGGGGVYKHYEDTASIQKFGRRAERLTDTGIGSTGTMDLIGAKFLAENSSVEIKLVCTIIDNQGSEDFGYDIESINPGDTCSFFNFNSTVSSLLKESMIITSVEYTPNSARITIEPIRVSISEISERLKRQISENTAQGMMTTYT